MAGKGDTYEVDLLKLLFMNTPIANIADAAASGPLTALYFALHSADPGESGTQTTSEVTTGAYTGYARTALARANIASPPGNGFTITGSIISPAQDVTFPACTGGTGVTATFFSIGTAPSGAGKILYFGALNPSIPISNGTTPRITNGTQISED